MCARSLSWTRQRCPGGYTFEHLRDELALRIAAIPEFRAKLADSQLNLDYPVWVEDDAFDLDRHLLRIGFPSPGGRRELAEVCGHTATAELERDRPLWEMWVIEGVCDTDPCAGGVFGGDDQGPSRRGGRGDRRELAVAAVQRRTRHAAAVRRQVRYLLRTRVPGERRRPGRSAD
jgi:hypothetical protein